MGKLKKCLGFFVGLGFLLWGLTAASLAIGNLTTARAIAAPLANQARPNSPSNADVLHLLNRSSFGPIPQQIQQVQAQGLEHYLQQQLHPDSILEPISLSNRLSQFKTLSLSQTELNQTFRPNQKNKKGQRVQPDQAFARQVKQEAIAARLHLAVESPRQLQEVMVDFWFNHFNVYSGKDRTKIWTGAYERDAIRPYAMGNFRDLLGATARHPAMLFYLDNWRNSDPNNPKAKGQFRGLNENYARELMELHTLGVEGGYSQTDVQSLTRILTGWSLNLNADPQKTQSSFQFARQRHDFSDKQFLGHSIKGLGQPEVEQALDILAQHPATARHISTKLAQYFVADTPPKELVEALTQSFQAHDGDIPAVLNTLFHHPSFWDERYYNRKFKTPYQYVVSTLRLSQTHPENAKYIQNILRQSGMPIHGCKTPDGYSQIQSDWLSPDGLTRRIDFVSSWAWQQKLQKQSASLLKAANEASASGGGAQRFSPQSQQAIQAAPKHLRSALILGSPELMWR